MMKHPNFNTAKQHTLQPPENSPLSVLNEAEKNLLDQAISHLCVEFLEREILVMDSKKNKNPLDLSEFSFLMADNWNKIQ